MRKHPKKENLQIILTNNSSIFLKTTLALNLEIEFDVYNNSVWNPNIKKNQIQKNRLTKFIQRYSTKK
jgi:hypothetical protein